VDKALSAAPRVRFQQARQRQDEIIIVTEQVARWLRREIDELRYSEALPIVVEVPGPEGPVQEGPSLLRLIREAVGIRFEV